VYISGPCLRTVVAVEDARKLKPHTVYIIIIIINYCVIIRCYALICVLYNKSFLHHVLFNCFSFIRIFLNYTIIIIVHKNFRIIYRHLSKNNGDWYDAEVVCLCMYRNVCVLYSVFDRKTKVVVKNMIPFVRLHACNYIA